MLRMIYPADRWVTESQIRNWYDDAVANGDIKPFYVVPKEFGIIEMVEALNETGKFTFSKEYK